MYPDQLQSERLITRKLVAEDVSLWTNFFADKEAVELFPTFGLSTKEERARHWIDKQLDRYTSNRYGLQALICKETGEFIGQCGLLEQVDDICVIGVRL